MSATTRRSPLRRAAALLVTLRWLVIVGWIVGAVAASQYLPSVGESATGEFGSLIPTDAPAIQARIRSAELFAAPLLTETAIVQRRAEGMTRDAQRRVFLRAERLLAERPPAFDEIAYALPVTNSLGVIPEADESGTTAITFLFYPPRYSLATQQRVAREFIAAYVDEPDDAVVGVTGAAPARVEQVGAITDALPLIEAATVTLILLVVGVHFRGVVAPLVVLFAVGVAYLVSVHVVGWAGGVLGYAVPGELEPLMVVLLLGVVTDYAIFFLSSFRRHLADGERRHDAARATVVDTGPIVFVAGVVVAAGTATMAVAELEFFRVLGPGMGMTVLIAVVVSATLIPALLAVFGRVLFWPAPLRGGDRRERGAAQRRSRLFASSRSRLVAPAVVIVSTVLLLALATGVSRTALGFTVIRGLDDDTEVARAAKAATDGFAPGILAPTVLLLERDDIVRDVLDLVRFEELLEQEPGVAGVIGPREQIVGVPLGAVLARGGDAARYAVVLDADPFGAPGIARLRAIERRLPALLEEAGLSDAEVGIGGNTALASQTVETLRSDLVRIGIVALLVNFVLLLAFLRAPLAAFYLLAASVVGLGAALGLTTYVFQDLLGQTELTYYVPFAAAVLLLSLGSDYTIFVAGRVWHEARGRPLRETVGDAAAGTSGAVTAAGLALALSFALLALVPLDPFRTLAFALAVGVLLDAFVVRTLLVPALIAAMGEWSRWPYGRLGLGQPRSGSPPREQQP